MNILLVGTGSIAEQHATAIEALRGTPSGRDLRVGSVVGRDAATAAAFARRVGAARAATALDEALGDPAVDAVLLCSPTDQHAEQTERALRAGKHVLCEIPLATSLAETDRLIALADGADLRLGVCHTQRYHPALTEMRRMVEAGELRPRAVVGRYLFLRRDTVNWMGRRRTWTDNLLWHHGCHAVDAALWLLGATEVATAAQVAPPSGPLGIPMDVGIAMRTPDGRLATVALSYNSHLPAHDVLLIGDETTVLFADDRLRGPEGTIVEADDGAGLDAIAQQDADFFAAVREGREPPVSGRSVRPAMAALQAAQDGFEATVAGSEAATARPSTDEGVGSSRNGG